jgi:hypothetical protein
MTFRELMRYLERRLGYHQVPLNPSATGLRDLIESSPVHPALLEEVVRAIHRGNRCRGLDDPVERLATLEAFGPVRLKWLRAAGTDVDTHRLLETLCEVLDEAFDRETHPTSLPPGADRRARAPTSPPPRAAAQIVALDAYRRRRSLKFGC